MPHKSHTRTHDPRSLQPGDATLSVTRAARILGVHANTVRSWSDAGRLRYYRINERGDRRYRLADLQRFLAAAASGPAGATGHGDPGRAGHPKGSAAPSLTESPAGFDLLAGLAEVASFPSGLDPALDEACVRVRAVTGAALVGVWERRPAGLVQRAIAVEGVGVDATRTVPTGENVLTLALAADGPVHARPGVPGPLPALGIGTDELAVAIPGGDRPWGVLVLAGAVQLGPDDGRRLAQAIARTLGVLVRAATATVQATTRLRRSEALRRISTDLASRLDVGDVVQDLGDHARVLFGADRVAVILRDPEGRVSSPGGIGFNQAFLQVARQLEAARSIPHDIPRSRPIALIGRGAPRAARAIRDAAIGQGVATLVAVPLVDGHELFGMLYLGHDRPQPWSDVDLEAAAGLAGDAAVAVRSARTFGRMATWASQLQSIQRLGTRLSSLADVRQIGLAIANELQQLIDYHNVRVYRVRGEELVPVAMLGQVGEYFDETPDQLRTRVGEGLTGWVARHRVPQLVDDAARDPRARTIPGTEPGLDESMLLAPMVHEDQCLGVLVLSRLGLRQFAEDDLRLLAIYASFAAQAMANADAAEQVRNQAATLERQLRAQRALLRTTESILTTLDRRAVLEQIADRLGSLVACDNLAIEASVAAAGRLVPLIARGVHAEAYLTPREPGETGIGTWVAEHNEPVLLPDERADSRVNQFRSIGPVDGAMIVVPLIGPDGATGVLTLERLGSGARFDDGEFELVKLFAAQVSIALRNAEMFQAVEVRAQTDTLTGLLNHGTFQDRLRHNVAAGQRFGLVMLDLDAFKRVNDTLGHQAGDRLLREIAAAIERATRDTDSLFRYGGDEFTVILPYPGPAGLAVAAERLRAAVAEVGRSGTSWSRAGLQVTASAGTASYPDDGATAEAVLLAADRACIVAKRRGHDNVATAIDGLALAGEITTSAPTPMDPSSLTTAGR